MRTVLLLGMVLAIPSLSQAQWRLGAEIGTGRFWGATHAASTEDPEVRPSRHTTFGTRLVVGGEKTRFALGVRYGDYGLSAEGAGEDGGGVVITFDGMFAVVSVTPSASFRLTSFQPGVDLRAGAGVMLESWKFSGVKGHRTRVGPVGSIGLDVTLSRAFLFTLTGEVAAIGSPFTEEDLIISLRRSTAWRRELYGGLLLKL